MNWPDTCKLIASTLIVVSLVGAGAGQASRRSSQARGNVPDADAIEITADPAFKVVLTGDKLRVLRLDLAPGAGTQLDQHPHDYLVMALTAGAVEFANSVSSQHLDLQPEELQIVTGRWAHRTTNKGSSPLALIEIEFTHDLDPQHALCGLNKPSCKTGEVGNEIGEYTRATLFETATVRVEKDEIEPDAAIPEFYAKRPTLLLAMTPLNLTAASLDEPGKTLDVQKNPGDVLLWPADTNHKLTNSGKDEARFYSIEPR